MINNILIFPILFVSVILHEIAHGLAAEWLGDNTARRLGRISLNPIRHIDPFMTIFLPGLLILSGSPIVFGGAKPVPVNPAAFKNPRQGMAIVAIAGPITNFILAAISLGFFYLTISFAESLEFFGVNLATYLLPFFALSVTINIVLAGFNLLPIPPLDGGRIVVGILPLPIARQIAKLERYGLLIVVLLLYLGVVDKFLSPLLSFASWSLGLSR